MAIAIPVAGVPRRLGLRTAEPRTSPSPELGDHPRGARRVRRARRMALVAGADGGCAVLVAALLVVAGTRSTGATDLALVLAWPLLLLLSGGYADGPADRRRMRVLRAGAVLGLVCWSLPTVADVATPPGELVLVTAVLTASALLLRAAADTWAAHGADAAGATRLLVAGDPAEVSRAVAELHRGPRRSWQVVSACVADAADAADVTTLDVPLAWGLDDLAGRAAAVDADAVLVLPGHSLSPLALRRVAWEVEAARIDLYVGTALHDVAPARATVMTAGDLGLLQVRPTPSGSPGRIVKELAERVGAALLLLALLPLLVVVAVAVRRDSPGPAIFRQRRIGRDGRDFTMYKFRTMRTDSEALLEELTEQNESDGNMLFKMRQDPRITRLGATLRRYSVDELPQLVNVVLGDMALIGPRPALPDEVARYEHDPRRRLCVKPGLTGLWQVSGRSDLSWEDTVRLDVHYVDNWSLGLDLRIACRTIRAVLRHDGAY